MEKVGITSNSVRVGMKSSPSDPLPLQILKASVKFLLFAKKHFHLRSETKDLLKKH